MAVLTKPKYTIGGTWTVTDPEGMPVEFNAGDLAPDWLLTRLSRGEMDIHLREGRLREVGAPPAPRPVEAPPPPLSPLEVFQAALWHRATEEDGQIRGVPGCEISVLSKPPRPADVERMMSSRETGVLVHPAGDGWIATVDLVRLARLLAGRTVR